MGDWSKDGYSKIPPLPYQGYKFLDYKEVEKNKPTGKYFRTSWVDTNKTQECIQIGSFDKERYSDVTNQGKCLIKEEIAEGEVSRWEYIEQSRKLQIFNVIDLRIDSTISIKDTKNNQLVSEVVRVIWKGGWLYGLLASIPVGNSWKVQYPRIVDIDFNQFIQQTLKIKKEER